MLHQRCEETKGESIHLSGYNISGLLIEVLGNQRAEPRHNHVSFRSARETLKLQLTPPKQHPTVTRKLAHD